MQNALNLLMVFSRQPSFQPPNGFLRFTIILLAIILTVARHPCRRCLWPTCIHHRGWRKFVEHCAKTVRHASTLASLGLRAALRRASPFLPVLCSRLDGRPRPPLKGCLRHRNRARYRHCAPLRLELYLMTSRVHERALSEEQSAPRSALCLRNIMDLPHMVQKAAHSNRLATRVPEHDVSDRCCLEFHVRHLFSVSN